MPSQGFSTMSVSMIVDIILLNNLYSIINFNFMILRFCFSTSSRLFVIAGQGTQEKGMLKHFINSSNSQVQHIMKKAQQATGLDFIQISTTDSNKIINYTPVTQSILLLSHYLHFKYLMKQTLRNSDYIIGHSLGQISALVLAESIDLYNGLKLVKKRGELMTKYTNKPCGMMIVKLRKQSLAGDWKKLLEKIKQHELQIACYNSPINYVIAGPMTNLNTLKADLKQLRLVPMLLPVSASSHISLLRPMKSHYQQQLKKIKFQPPKAKIIRNYDCKIYQTVQQIVEGLNEQIDHPVLFSQSVKTLPVNIPTIQIGHKQWIMRFVQQTRELTFQNT